MQSQPRGNADVTFEFRPATGTLDVSVAALQRVIGDHAAALVAAPHRWLRAVHAGDVQRVEAALADFERHGSATCSLRVREQPSGAIRWLRVRAHRGTDDDGEARVLGAIIDVTREVARHVVEEALRGERDDETIGLEDRSELVMRCAPDGRLLYANALCGRFFGLPTPALRGRLWGELAGADATAEARRMLESPTPRQPMVERELWSRTGAGLRLVRWRLRGAFDAHGHLDELVGVGRDVTDERGREQLLANALAERDALLREVHHRVKNDLQVVWSLLRLQLEDAEDSHVQALLRDAESRLRATMLVHEHLSESHEASGVRALAYLTKLVADILVSHGRDGLEVEVEHSIEDLWLGWARAVPCGLVVNEAVTNALRHAFGGRIRGRIRIGLALRDDRTRIAELSVTDDGVGLPSGFDTGTAKTLGVPLMTNLARQMGGSARIGSGLGTRVEVCFPLEETV